MIMLLLISLLLFAFVSPVAACTDVNWTIKCNGRDVSGQYLCKEGETRPVYSFQIPVAGDTDGRKITVYYRIDLRQTGLIPSPAPQPVPDPRPNPVPIIKPTPDLQWPPFKPGSPDPDPQPPRPKPPVPVPDPEPQPVPQPGETELSADELRLFQLVNEERLQAGLSELKIHTGLVELARLKSRDMIALNYFAHRSPTYGLPFEMMQQAGIAYAYTGENLAGAPTVERAHTSLMNSPGHRANILSSDFTHVGIGIIDGGPYGKMVTQMFIKPR